MGPAGGNGRALLWFNVCRPNDPRPLFGSLARNFPNSAGELGGSTNPPRSTRRVGNRQIDFLPARGRSRSVSVRSLFFSDSDRRWHNSEGAATARLQPLSGAKWKSKPPGEIALDRMVVRTVGELARIGDADLGLRGELQIAARFDQRGVARNRNTQDIEP